MSHHSNHRMNNYVQRSSEQLTISVTTLSHMRSNTGPPADLVWAIKIAPASTGASLSPMTTRPAIACAISGALV